VEGYAGEAGETEYLLPEPPAGSEMAGCHRRRARKESLNLLPNGEEAWLDRSASQPLPGVKRERAAGENRLTTAR
jgi:hypothetical protein